MESKTFEKIIELLDQYTVEYVVLKHKPVYTSQDAANIRGTNLSSGAKALIFKADGKPVMIVVPGDKRVDPKKFKERYKISDLAFVHPEEVEKILYGVKIGAVHPFGNLHDLKVYVDKALGKNREIVFSAGMHEKSIKMSFKDYYKIVKPVIGEFSD